MKIAIYQINPDRDENNVAFLNYENLERFQGSAALRSEIYDKVFEGEVECGTLEEVYQMFNLDHPDGYRGRSLSVSDVVEVVGEEKSTFHFCDSIGFREVDFDPDMTEPLKEKKIKVVLCEPGKVARVAEIGTELSDLQRVVGGLIEPYYPFEEQVCIVCNDEGKYNGMRPCRAIYGEDREMMDINWVVQNLENALEVWNDKLSEIWQLITQSPQTFKGGSIWSIICSIHGALQAIGYALLVLFFVVGVVKTCGSFADLKKPEHAVKLFVRFAIAKGLITYGMELMMAILEIIQGVVSTIMNSAGFGSPQATVLPQEIITAVEDCGFFESIPLWAVTLIGGLFIWVLSFVMIMSVYGRFFKMYMYTALAPIPLSAFAGEPTQNIGKSFLKSYASVCLEGAIIVLACIIFTVFASSPPFVDPNAAPASMVWSYIGELIFNMLILVGAVKMADRLVKEMIGI